MPRSAYSQAHVLALLVVLVFVMLIVLVLVLVLLFVLLFVFVVVQGHALVLMMPAAQGQHVCAAYCYMTAHVHTTVP